MQFSIYPFDVNVETRRIGPFLETRYDLIGCHEIIVAYVAVDQLPFLQKKLHYQVRFASYNILRTYWELPNAPRAWSPLLRHVDELWVPNSYIADAFRGIYNGEITVIPVPIEITHEKKYPRRYFNMFEDRFYYLFSFDYYSGTVRKNPLGVLHAFTKAFPNRDEDVGLIIKSTGPPELDVVVSCQLEMASKEDTRIQLIHTEMGREEMLSLIEQSDCYVSLHRAEGFGMGMAEALAFGKPVIGTDFSGNQEFLTSQTGFPVRCTIRKLLPGEYPEGDNQYWAEPDLEAAAEQMQRVFADREESARRGAAGEALIKSSYAPERIAQLVSNRIIEIRNAIHAF